MLLGVIALSVLVLALAAGCAALLWDRSRQGAEAARLLAREEAAAARAAELAAALRETNAERDEADARLSDATAETSALRARLDEQATHADERLRAERSRLDEVEKRYQAAFAELAQKALKDSSEHFLRLAEKTFAETREKTRAELDTHVKPIAETLKKADTKLAEIEKERLASFERLAQQVRAVAEGNALLRAETGNLVAALRKPQVRGRYGEIQLERVAELAGMRSYCDFSTQESSRDDEGRIKRPDMIVRLPNGRAVAVDAKTNIEAYLDAIEATDPQEADRHLDRFARHVAEQAQALAKKEYAERAGGALDFVVMFIPGDQFIDAALQRRPDLLDRAAQDGVILASPSTLVGLLRAVHVGWREKRLTDNAQELMTLGRELHDRAGNTLQKIAELGTSIDAARNRFNALVGSVDGRLMPTLRRFEEHGAKSTRDIRRVETLDAETRELRSLPGANENGPDITVRPVQPNLQDTH